jgi:hypothetical protein
MNGFGRHVKQPSSGFCRAVTQDFLGGTFFPAFLAFDNPMAIACLRLVTFLPLRPDLSLPFFISLISVSTFFPAEGEYFRPEDFFADEPRLVLLFFVEELLFFLLLDFFFAAFFVAIDILLENQMFSRFESVVWQLQASAKFRFVDEHRSYTMRRIPGSRTSGSASSQQAMHASVPATPNFTSAGATQWVSRSVTPTSTGGWMM